MILQLTVGNGDSFTIRVLESAESFMLHVGSLTSSAVFSDSWAKELNTLKSSPPLGLASSFFGEGPALAEGAEQASHSDSIPESKIPCFS